ncbi:MAG: molybdopterin molybdotransferase MoeA [Thermoanaerobaculia bacterium]
MIRPETAWTRIEEVIEPLPAEALPRRTAGGRVLARPLAATVDVPAADVSAMDGFAPEGAPPLGRPVPVAGLVAAGDAPGRGVPADGVLRIMTGAPVPRGADRVIPVERTRLAGTEPEAVVFEAAGAPGDHVRRRGEVIRAGEELLPAGALLTPGGLALLATHGHGEVAVHGAPRVALAVTGDEVVPPEEEPAPGQLRDSHSAFARGACATLGLELEALGIAPDEPRALRSLVDRGLAADVLLLSGGVSMGELDLVEGVLREAGCEPLFDAVAVQPGKPLLAAVGPPPEGPARRRPGRRTLVFGLPGNPASVMVCFWLFVRPALRRLLGRQDRFWHGALEGELVAPLPAGKPAPRGRDRFLPAEVSGDGGRLLTRPVAPVGSHDLGAYARGTALVRIRPGEPAREAGEPCEVLPLADWP